MNRCLTCLVACLIVVAPTTRGRAQSLSELAQTARYAAALQNPDGGFAATTGGASSLGATNSAIRILKYAGGPIPDVLGCIRFVKSCYIADPGGFAQAPGGKPDVSTSALGLMALSDLKIADQAMTAGAVGFLEKNAKSFEEVRIAVAGLEAVNGKSAKFAAWEALVREGRNGDGTFGQGVGLARETGGKAAALLRMGVALDRRDAIVAALKKAQRPEGAWGRDDSGSELDSTYRIMRFFFMAREAPDLDRLRGFIAKCAVGDGRYALKPGGEPTLGATYNASIILYWSRLLAGEPANVETAGFQPLFNGKDLSGWEGETSLWSARKGLLVGDSPGIKQNQFLATEARYDDFVLKLTFRLKGGVGNSGVMFRSERVPGTEMSGYQADVGENYWGCLYDESRRNKVLVHASAAAEKALRKDGWNHYVIDARGDDVRLSLNGVQSVAFHEPEAGIAREGRIAVQIHSGGPLRVEFKDLYLQALPRPKTKGDGSPGFFLESLKTGDGERKYTVYVPTKYDGKTAVPVVLFLHGAGERGSDGVRPAQTGIGPAILRNRDAFQAIVVIPQARTTWAAGSADAKAALAALDAVMARYKTDPNRVVLTGLSMGGRGSWENAAAEPGRFAAVVPICGPGSLDSAAALAKLPVWAFCGDADRDQTVLNLRSMVEALNAAGGKAKLTEYRGVGHNSWDRAYNDPALIDWMLARKRP